MLAGPLCPCFGLQNQPVRLAEPVTPRSFTIGFEKNRDLLMEPLFGYDGVFVAKLLGIGQIRRWFHPSAPASCSVYC